MLIPSESSASSPIPFFHTQCVYSWISISCSSYHPPLYLFSSSMGSFSLLSLNADVPWGSTPGLCAFTVPLSWVLQAHNSVSTTPWSLPVSTPAHLPSACHNLNVLRVPCLSPSPHSPPMLLSMDSAPSHLSYKLRSLCSPFPATSTLWTCFVPFFFTLCHCCGSDPHPLSFQLLAVTSWLVSRL